MNSKQYLWFPCQDVFSHSFIYTKRVFYSFLINRLLAQSYKHLYIVDTQGILSEFHPLSHSLFCCFLPYITENLVGPLRCLGSDSASRNSKCSQITLTYMSQKFLFFFSFYIKVQVDALGIWWCSGSQDPSPLLRACVPFLCQKVEREEEAQHQALSNSTVSSAGKFIVSGKNIKID